MDFAWKYVNRLKKEEALSNAITECVERNRTIHSQFRRHYDNIFFIYSWSKTTIKKYDVTPAAELGNIHEWQDNLAKVQAECERQHTFKFYQINNELDIIGDLNPSRIILISANNEVAAMREITPGIREIQNQSRMLVGGKYDCFLRNGEK